ncbi:MAG: hypothetical protein ACT4R6_11205, partial [Gemmatimonadaceae bacterium]
MYKKASLVMLSVLITLLGSRCTPPGDGITAARKAPRGSAIASVVVLLGANTLGIGDTTSARVEVRNGAGALVTDRFV